ncbi:large neutral amino acids transporter small subunit 1-like [Haliotis rubra]|uniref:large neutral amino acids transporter small subunit 1-like n=1 Tax=Haliotis rubra TaxID=36100 RepID=UPI001EE5A341|nr:large neutral amino acids transporter small subunit 1-like [Haliotis rubra]
MTEPMTNGTDLHDINHKMIPEDNDVKRRKSSGKVIVENQQEPKLERSIGLFSATTMLIANTGGNGIFIASTATLYYAGSPGFALVLWVLSGLVNFGLSSCMTEVGLILPKAGGPYFYVTQVFGSLPGFVMLWGFLWMIMAPAWAIGAYTASLYIVKLSFPDCTPPEVGVKLLAAAILVFLVFLNCLYMKIITKFQSILSLAKVIAMLIIIIGDCTKRYREQLPLFWEGTTTDPGNIALGLVSGYFSYGGWQVISILMEEVKDPVRNVPRSLGLTFISAIILYTLTNFSYCVVLTTPEMLQSNAVAVTFAYRLHSTLSVVISILVALCCLSVLNVLILGQPRMVFAAGCNGHMPRIMSMINRKYLTPWPATIFISVPALAVLFSGSVVSLIDAMSLYTCLMTSSVIVVLLYLRWKKPTVKRPIKVPLIIPIVELILSVVLICLSIYKKPKELGLCLGIVAVGIPVYFIFIMWKSKPKSFVRFMDRSTLFLKTLLNVETPAQ